MSKDSPAAILYDAAGVAMAVEGGVAVPAGTKSLLVAGSDGTNARVIRTATDGTVRTDPTGTTTQPISAATLPLPAGAATEATLALIKAKTDNLDVALSTRAVTGLTDAQLRAVAVPVSAASLPLPAGAATEATLATRASETKLEAVRVLLASLDGKDFSTQTTLAALLAAFNAEDFATQATLALIKAKTDNLDVALSTRATAAAQTNGTQKTQQVDGAGNVMPSGDVLARAIYHLITDGTTGPVAVKPASTAAAAADKSLVVTMSPFSAPITITNTPAGARTGVSYALKVLGGGTAGTLQVMRSTVYTEPTSAAQRSVSSSSASDTAAGVGARTVKITYYNNTGAGPFTETVTLNGTTTVNTVATDIRFIENIEVVTAGSTLSNVGTISLFGTTGGGGGTVGTIGVGTIVAGVGDNRTLWSHHYIAAGYTAQMSVLVIGIQSGGSATNGQFFVRSSQPLVANSAEVIVGDSVLAIGTFERVFTFNPNIVGFARLTAYSVPGVNNATVSCAFDWSEVVS